MKKITQTNFRDPITRSPGIWLFKRFNFYLFIGLVLFFGATENAHAVNPQTLDIHISINATKSLSAAATYYNFGALDVGVSSVSAVAVVVTNNSSAIVETFTLLAGNAISDTAGGDWTLQSSSSSVGTDSYAIAAQFSTSRPNDNNVAWDSTDYLDSSAQVCTPNRFGNGMLGEAGTAVFPSTTRNLWFRIHTPTAVTDPGGHTAQVTLAVQ